MARIPIYQQQVTPRAVDMPTSARGARIMPAMGNGLQSIAEGLNSIGAAVQAYDEGTFRLNQQRMAAFKEKTEEEGRIWAAKATSEADLAMYEHLQKRQQNTPPGASGFTPSFLKDFDEYAEKAVANAPSDYAKNLMRAHIARSREVLGRTSLQFEAAEGKRYRGQQFDEGVQMDATLVAANPTLFAQSMGKWAGVAAQSTDGPETAAQLRKVAKDVLAKAAVKGWIDQNAGAAATLLEGWTKNVKPGEPATVTMTTATGSTDLPIGMLDYKDQQLMLEYAQQKKKEYQTAGLASLFIDSAKTVVGSAPLQTGDVIDLPKAKQAAVEEARRRGAVLTPEQQLQLENYVEKVASDRERDVRRQRETYLAGMFTQLEKNGGDYQALIAANPAAASMPAEQRMRLNEFAGRVATGQTRPTDWVAYSELVNDPALLKSTNLDARRDRFSAQEFAQLRKLQDDLQRGLPEQNIVSDMGVLKRMLEEAGYGKDEKREAKFFSLVQQAINQELAANPARKSLPQTRIKEIAEDLIKEDKIGKGSILGIIEFDRTGRPLNLEVPSAERTRIEAALIAAGLPVNDYNVLQAYRRELQRRAGQLPRPPVDPNAPPASGVPR